MALVYSYFPPLSGYSVVSSAAGGGPASCEGSNPIIPEYYNGVSGNLPVVRIGTNAFSSCNDIQTITLPNTIKIIANGAFAGSSIKNINIPDSVNSIGVVAFSVCSQLTSVRLSNNLTSLPSNLFVSCSSLKSINIPDSITGIANSVFAQCSSLDNVVLGKNLKSLGGFCFAQCFNLNNLYFKGDLPSTGNSIFSLLDPSQIKIKIKKYFVTGWENSFGGAPVVLWSDNVIKSGGTGKLTTKKRPNFIYTLQSVNQIYNPSGIISQGLKFYITEQTLTINLSFGLDPIVTNIYYDETNTYALWAIRSGPGTGIYWVITPIDRVGLYDPITGLGLGDKYYIRGSDNPIGSYGGGGDWSGNSLTVASLS